MSDQGSTPPPPPGGGSHPPHSDGGYPAPPPAPGYAEGSAYMGQRPHPKGTMILVLGILSLICIQLLGPVAWIMGNGALREIDANPGAYNNRGTVNAGRICGIVGTIFLVLGVIAWIFVMATGAMTANTGV